jgi:predicted aminopeptidase
LEVGYWKKKLPNKISSFTTMVKLDVFIAIVLSAVTLSSCQVNWCTIPSCAPGTHIACNNNGAFAATCNTPSYYTLSVAQKQQILNTHNALRNLIALGRLPNFSPARRMAQLQWDDQLAAIAELNTRQCKMAHDTCRNTRN